MHGNFSQKSTGKGKIEQLGRKKWIPFNNFGGMVEGSLKLILILKLQSIISKLF